MSEDSNDTSKGYEKELHEKENPKWFDKLGDYTVKFFYPTTWKKRIAGGLTLVYLVLGPLNPTGHHIEQRNVEAGPHGQQNYAVVFNPIFHWFSHIIGRGEMVYTEYMGKRQPDINIPTEVGINYVIDAIPFAASAYLAACVVVEGGSLLKRGLSRLNKYRKGG